MAAISEILARELGCAQAYVENIITLLDEGSTIPSSPATARSSTAPWTTRPSESSRIA